MQAIEEKKKNSFITNQELSKITLSSIGDAIITTDISGHITYMNAVAEELTGWDLQEIQGKVMDKVLPIINEDNGLELTDLVKKILKNITPSPDLLETNTLLITKNGGRKYIEDSASPIKDEGGNIKGVVFVFRDVSARKRLEKIVLKEKKVLELASNDLPLEQTLTTLLKNIEDISEDMLFCSILLIDNEEEIYRGIAPSLPEQYIKEIKGISINNETEPFKTFIEKKQMVTISDIKNDDFWKFHKELILNAGFKSCWSYPIIFNNNLLGLFVCYYKAKKEPSEKDIELIKRAVSIAGILIKKDITTIKLHKSESLIKEICSSIPCVLYQSVLDLKGNQKFLYLSDGFKELYDSTPQEVYDNPEIITNNLHPDDKNNFIESIQKSAKTMQPWFLEYRILEKEKSDYKWIRGNAVPVKKGKKIIWNGTLTDISNIKKADETIKIQNIYFQELFNASPFGIILFDTNKKILNANKGFEKLFQFSVDEIRGKNIKDFILPHEFYEEVFKLAYDNTSKNIIQFETRRKRKDGTLVDVLAMRYPVIINDSLNGYYVIYMDITERKKAEETLHIQERAIESAAEGIVITDAEQEDNPIVFANNQFCEYTGYSLKEIIGKNPRFLQGKDTDRNVVKQIGDAVRNSRTFKGDILNYKKDGTPFWHRAVLAPVVNRKGDTTHFVGLHSDISDLKKGEQVLLKKNAELRKINAELDRFVYSTSHDLRAPLTSVLGLITIAEMDTDTTRWKMYLERMKSSVKKLDLFIQDIINYSKNSRLDIKKEEINFRALTSEIQENLHFMPGAEKIKFNIDIDEKINFKSDKSRINIILNNLISNAIKYHNINQNNPYVAIKINITKEHATILIKDNGQGIAKDHQKKIFEMFYRASESSVGSGLGLYIVKEIIDKLKGTIKVESEFGIGTTFIVDIPNNIKKEKVILEEKLLTAEA